MSTNLDLGKILFVDDDFDRSEEGIKAVVASLVKKGLPVQYWDGKGSFPSHINNSRVIVLDLDLGNLGSRSGGPDFYSFAALALKQIPGPFIAIIMAREYLPDDPSNLSLYYKNNLGPLHGVIAPEGIKKEEASDTSRLQELIISSIQNEKALSLLLLWEKIVDKAKDKAFGDLISKEVTGTILSLVELLCRNVGLEAAAREFVDTLMRLVSQKTVDHEKFEELNKLVKDLNDKACDVVKPESYPTDQDRSLYNKLMFFTPDPEESVWTGDIFRTEEGRPIEESYAMVLTPACDFVQNKVCKVLVSFASTAPNSGGGDLPGNIFSLLNFKENGAGTSTIYFDLNKVQSVQMDIFKKWKRLCRLDSPFSEEVLTAYGTLVSRVGTLEINRGDKQLQKSLRRYRERQAQEKAKAKRSAASVTISDASGK